MPSSFLSSTSAICEVGGRGSSRCGGVPNEGRRGVSRDRGTRWLEVVFDLRSWLNADANGPSSNVQEHHLLAKFVPIHERAASTCNSVDSELPAGTVVESKLRQRRALEPICFHWRGIHSHKLPASISNCIFTNARPWGSRGSSSPSRLIIAADLGLTIDCIDSNENLCDHAKNAHKRLRAGCSLQGCRATTALMEQVLKH